MATTAPDLSGMSETPENGYPYRVEELTEVITRHFPSFYGTALRRVRNVADAEDAVQDACLSAFKHLHQFRGASKMSTWLTAIVINSSVAITRRRARQLSTTLDINDEVQDHNALREQLSDLKPNPEASYYRQEVTTRIAELSKRLPPVVSRVFELRYAHELSVKEIARTLDVSEVSVRVYLSRARAQIRRWIYRKHTSKSAESC